jgi:hypothetical protein
MLRVKSEWDIPGVVLPPDTKDARSGAELVTLAQKKNRKGKIVPDYERMFKEQCLMFQLPPFETQYKFAKEAMGRLWKFDFAWIEYKLAVEIEGLVPMRIWRAELAGPKPIEANGRVVNVKSVQTMMTSLGRHSTTEGMRGDMEKYNAALELGWSVLRFEQVAITRKDREPLNTVMRVLSHRGWKR